MEKRNLKELLLRLRRHMLDAKKAELDLRTAAPIAKHHIKLLKQKYEDAAMHTHSLIEKFGGEGFIIKVTGVTSNSEDFEFHLTNVTEEEAQMLMRAQAIKNPELIAESFKFEAIPLKRLIIYT